MNTLKKVSCKNKKVLLRCDFDVPLSKKGEILDNFRIEGALPTIQYLIKNKAKVVLIGHMGRPHGKVIRSLRLTPVQKRLSKCLGIPVAKTADCVGPEAEKAIADMGPGEVILLENLRFHKEEEENDKAFAKKLAELGDIYVNNAFANSHRNHASMTGIPRYLPSASGFLLEKEIKILNNLIKKPEKPLVAVIGGAKVETKANLINRISEIADTVLIGGLIAREIKEKDIYLNYPRKIVSPAAGEIETKDIGPKTVKLFRTKIMRAKTVFFNGVVGEIEDKRFTKGTEEILKAIIKSKAFSIIGGGDTVKFVNKLGLTSKFNYISTGGGAMIAFLAGEKLPGAEALK